MGGEITWTCNGGNYTFKVVLYRDCNGQALNQTSIDLGVANHPSISQIQCDLVSQTDISPQCQVVAGGPPALDCGSGSNGGNGLGAVEKFVFESAPIGIPGTPPADGWYFYWSGFSRNANIDNIDNPIADGITLYAKMYDHPSAGSGACYDQSPQFGMDPIVVIASGKPYIYNQAAIDPDLDSLRFSLAPPQDQYTAGTFNPPTNPGAIDFNAGYSYTNPTPDATFNAANVPMNVDPVTGTVTFTSFTQGNYVYCIKVEAYRDGQIISENIRDIQIAVPNMGGYNNDEPDVTPPFNGNTSFETEVYAGDVVNFNLDFEDLDALQDGSQQNVTVEGYSSQFGNNFTDPNNGCNQPPCATLNQSLPATFLQNGQLAFNWQTDCGHLLNTDGNYVAQNTFLFVFKISDDYCQAPQNTYATVKVVVKDKDRLPAPELTCLQVQPDGSVEVFWETLTNGGNGFVEYQVNNSTMGNVHSEPNINTGNYLDNSIDANTGSIGYNVATVSGCNGHFNPQSPTLNTIHLSLNNPGDGTAILQWTPIATPFPSDYNDWYYVEREYPTGTWTVLDSVREGETLYYRDTIDICDAFINYRISVEHNSGCKSTSNIVGDQLGDNIAPYIPEVASVSVDSSNGFVDIEWNVNGADDTYGYIIYEKVNGFWVPLDTVWGRFNNSFEHMNVNPSAGPLTYSVAAFDSCNTSAVPPTYQTSAKSTPHTTIHLTIETDPCDAINTVSWTAYEGWADVDHYSIIANRNYGGYEEIATTSELTYEHKDIVRGELYCYYIVAHHADGRTTFSNEFCLVSQPPGQPSFTYLSSASVINNQYIAVNAYVDDAEEYDYINILRKDGGQFDSIATIPYGSGVNLTYNDNAITDFNKSYTYQLQVMDTCGLESATSNIAKTMYLRVSMDTNNLKTTIQWTPYSNWNGFIQEYRLYRGVDGLFGSTPIATLSPNVRAYEDDVNAFIDSEGKFCYKVEAVESLNGYGFSSQSFSNYNCAIRKPIIYIPNAFIIGSTEGNDVFRPVVSLYEFESYDLTIFDRWGNIIYNTQDRHAGWDGRNNKGAIQAQGVYVYMLEVKDAYGKIYQRRGTVTLLKTNPDR